MKKQKTFKHIRLPLAVLGSFSLLTTAMPTAMASTPSISLNISSLNYGYTGPQSITVTGSGEDFNGTSVVYVLNPQGSVVTSAATGFQTVDSNHLTFNLAAGLGNAGADTTYEVEVRTIVNGTTVETSPEQPLVIHQISASETPSSVQAGYTQAVSVTIALSGMTLDNQASLKLYNSGSQDVTGTYVSGTSISGSSVNFTLGTGLQAGAYTFKIDDGSNTVNVPFTVTGTPASMTITTTTLPAATPGQSYTAQLSANQGANWSMVGSSSWVTVNQDGSVTGTVPSNFDGTSIKVQATPTVGSAMPATKSFTIAAASALPDKAISATPCREWPR